MAPRPPTAISVRLVLCRYITRPALSDERVQLNAAGLVELKLKTPWRDGTTHLVMSPLESTHVHISGRLWRANQHVLCPQWVDNGL